jgi:hypothetical protein
MTNRRRIVALFVVGATFAAILKAQRVPASELSANLAAASPRLPAESRQAMRDRIDAVNASFRAAHGGQAPEDFGLQCCQITQIPSSAFVPIDTDDESYIDSYGYRGPTSGSPDSIALMAPVLLPSGVAISFLDIYYYSADQSFPAVAQLIALKGSGGVSGPPGAAVVAVVDSSGHDGYGYLASSQFSYTVNNNVAYDPDAAQLVVQVMTSHFGVFTSRFKAVDLWWMRQISPPPATPTFSDVQPGHPFFQFVEALAAAGVTVGYPDGRFGVDDAITRGQMAVFLAKALGLYWPF